ncbi:MAG: glycoside hydrolase family 73 protein [Burkholderiaceae bacterium]
MTKAHHSVKKKHVHVDPPYVTNFIDAHKDVAQKLGKQYNIPASVLLAQSAQETRWGLKVVGNAYFGIKGKSPAGNSVDFATHEDSASGTEHIQATFRAYESYDEAAEDYAQVVTTNKVFAGALLHRKEPAKFIAELAKHYATDKKYAQSVVSIIKSHHLEQYDSQ